jgi:hypothetical protein
MHIRNKDRSLLDSIKKSRWRRKRRRTGLALQRALGTQVATRIAAEK